MTLIYFTRASVLDDAFDELEVGTPIAFVDEKGEKGPQASTVCACWASTITSRTDT